MITIDLLQAICPNTRPQTLADYVGPLNDVAAYYDLNVRVERLAGFLAQVAHESDNFTAIRENMNYSADGLQKIFGKYFPTDDLAQQYARQPEKIANRVYANRMNNGDESSGDGWKFRGRGLIQLSGRANYTKFSQALDMSLDDTIAYMETPAGAASSAGWYWDTNKLNAYCDIGDFIGLTKRINGGTNGLESRQRKYEVAVNMLRK
jgi:putative chitinase